MLAHYLAPALSAHPAPVQHVQAKVLNRTAVRISWAPLWVPEGVSLLQYSIYSSTSHGASTPHGGFSASEMGGQIAGLLSEKVYSFWVVAHIQDADGSIMETPPSFVTPESTVFVPGEYVESISPIIHYCTGLYVECRWEMQQICWK